jgi:hypothetical protein
MSYLDEMAAEDEWVMGAPIASGFVDQSAGSTVQGVDTGGAPWYAYVATVASDYFSYNTAVKKAAAGQDATVSNKAGVPTADGSKVTAGGVSGQNMLILAGVALLALVLVLRR